MTRRRRLALGGGVVGWLAVAVAPARAHHVMGGQTPETGIDGFLSGLGHPIIGLDHLAFVVAVGLMASLLARPLLPPLAFLAATGAGAWLHVMGVDPPFAEFAVALSVLAAAALVITEYHLRPNLLTAAFALAGVFHGYAYGESIVGAEPAPLAAYMLGFLTVQSAIALGAATLLRLLTGRWLRRSQVMRAAGTAIAVVGVAAVGSALIAG